MAVIAALSLLMMALAACSGKDETPNASSASQPGASTQSGASNPPADSGGVPNLNPTGYPIVNDPIKLTFFSSKSNSNLGNWNEATSWKKYKEMTNIDVDFQLVPVDVLEEKRNLALTSGDLPDAFHTARLSAVDVADYGSQGIFIKLNDLIDKYAPNLKALMEKYPDIKKGIVMPDGNIYSFPTLLDPEFTTGIIGSQLWINQKFLDALQMKMPETTDELYAYFKAVKSTDLNGNGKADEVPFAGAGITTLYDQLKGAWGLGNRGNTHPRVDIDPATNKLRFIPTDPRNKELLEFLHRLDSEGMFYKDIFTATVNDVNALYPEGVIGAGIGVNPNAAYPNTSGYVGVSALKGPHGDQIFSRARSYVILAGGMVITKANKYPEATVRWIDSFYGEEGNKLFRLGVEGVSYVEKDGKYDWSDEIKADGGQIGKHVTWAGGWYPGMDFQKYILASETEPENLEVSEKIKPYFPELIWPEFTYSSDEIGEFKALESDIVTYVNEMTSKFVKGSVPFTDWDKYVDTLNKMGLDRYMEMYDTAYQRYLNS